MEDNHVFAFSGLPGSGKSTAAEMVGNALAVRFRRGITIEMSDFVRRRFYQDHDGTINDNELGRWSAEMKQEHGQHYFAAELAEELLETESEFYPIISGLRSPEEAAALRERFDTVTVIAIWTLPDIRFERKYGDEPSTDHPEWGTFQERNEREIWEWGCVDYFMEDGPSDYIVNNNDGIENLEESVVNIVRDELNDTDFANHRSPFPRANDREVIAQYL